MLEEEIKKYKPLIIKMDKANTRENGFDDVVLGNGRKPPANFLKFMPIKPTVVHYGCLLASLMLVERNGRFGREVILTPALVNDCLAKADFEKQPNPSFEQMQKEALYFLILNWRYGKRLAAALGIEKQKKDTVLDFQDFPYVQRVKSAMDADNIYLLKDVRKYISLQIAEFYKPKKVARKTGVSLSPKTHQR